MRKQIIILVLLLQFVIQFYGQDVIYEFKDISTIDDGITTLNDECTVQIKVAQGLFSNGYFGLEGLKIHAGKIEEMGPSAFNDWQLLLKFGDEIQNIHFGLTDIRKSSLLSVNFDLGFELYLNWPNNKILRKTFYQKIKLDSTPPAIIFPIKKSYNNQEVTINLDAIDEEAGIDWDTWLVRYKKDEGIFSEWLIDKEFFFSEQGEYTFEVKVIDKVGNESYVEERFYIDRIDPNVTIFSNGYTNKKSLVVNWLAVDNESGIAQFYPRYSIETLNGTSEWEIGDFCSISPELGDVTIHVKAQDKASNQTIVSKNIVYDDITPSINVRILKIPSVSDKKQVQIYCFDNKAIDLSSLVYRYQLAGNNYSPWINGNSFLLPEGRYQLQARVSDLATNQTTITQDIVIDTTPPVFYSIIAPEYSTDHAEISFITNDNYTTTSAIINRYRYKQIKSNGVFNTWQVGSSFSIEDEGRYEIEFQAEDSAGNIAMVTRWIIVDKTNPQIGVFSDIDWRNSPANFSVTISDPLSNSTSSGISDANIKYTITEGSIEGPLTSLPEGSYLGETLSFSVSFNSSGQRTITLYVTDNAGRPASTSATVKIDKTLPDFDINSEANLVEKDGNQYLYSFTVENISELVDNSATATQSGVPDAVSSSVAYWKYRFDSTGDWTSFSPIYSGNKFDQSFVLPDGMPAGSHTIYLQCTDRAGNVSDVVSSTFVLDKTAPVISIDSSPSSPFSSAENIKKWTNLNEFAVSVTETNLASFSYSLSTMGLAVWSSPVVKPISSDSIFIVNDGLYKLIFTASDTTGNVTTSIPYYLCIDTCAPEITSPLPTNSNPLNSIHSSATDAGCSVDHTSWLWSMDSVDNGNWQSGSSINFANYSDNVANGLQTIVFKVSDNVGNETEPYLVQVNIDTTAPTVSFNCASFAMNNTLAIFNISASDFDPDVTKGILGSGVDSLEYAIDSYDDSDFVALTWDGVQTNLSLSLNHNLSAGVHELYIRGVDALGNSGVLIEANGVSFAIDHQAPLITDLRILQHGITIDEDTYVDDSNFTVQLKAEDYYSESPDSLSDQLVSWRYLFASTELNIATLPNNYGTLASNVEHTDTGVYSFTVSMPSAEIRHLHIAAVDIAGNVTWQYRELHFDSGLPQAPRFAQASHRYIEGNVSDADPLANFSVQIVSQGSSVSGIASYEWSLQTSSVAPSERVWKKLDIITSAQSTLQLENLADNEMGESYVLELRSVGGNGKKSEISSYKFRVDTKPPAGMVVRTAPSVETTLGLNNGESDIYWLQPSDMTGVEAYYYRVSFNEERLMPDVQTQIQEADLYDWSKITSCGFPLNVLNFFKNEGKDNGTVFIDVIARDYIGNAMLDTISISADFALPLASKISGDKELRFTPDLAENSVQLGWSELSDVGSGLDYIDISIMRIGENGENTQLRQIQLDYDKDNPQYSYQFTELDSNTAYLVLFNIYDNAGNVTTISDFFALGNASIPMEILVPYEQKYKGIWLRGQQHNSNGKITGYSDVELEFGDLLTVEQIQKKSDDQFDYNQVYKFTAEAVVFDDVTKKITFVENEDSSEAAYRISVQGFVFTAKQLSFSIDSGLYAKGVSYERDYMRPGLGQVEASQQSMAISQLSIGFPSNFPLVGFSDNPADPFVATIIDNQNNIQPLYQVEPGNGSLQIQGANEVIINGSSEAIIDATWFSNAGLNLSYADMAADSHRLPLLWAKNQTNGAYFNALLKSVADRPIQLQLGKSRYEIIKAELRAEKLVVLEALITIPGAQPGVLTVRNFIVDGLTGTVSANSKDFYCDPCSIAGPNGETLSLNSFTINTQGELVGAGAADLNYDSTSDYNISGVLLNSEGADWSIGADFDGTFYHKIHGFDISSQSFSLRSQGILLHNASFFYLGQPHIVSNLGIRLDAAESDPDFIWQNGSGSETFSIEKGYGATITLSDVSIDDQGVLAKAAIPVDRTIFTDADTGILQFPQARLMADGGFQASASGVAISLKGFSGSIGNLVFDGNTINLDAVNINLPSGFTTEDYQEITTLTLGQGTLNAGEWISPLQAEGTYLYTRDGWSVYIENPILNTLGLGGSVYVVVPGKRYFSIVGFSDLKVSGDGSIESGMADKGSEINIANWSVSITNAELVMDGAGYCLSIPTPQIKAGHLDDLNMIFGKTTLNAQGQIISTAPGTTLKSFTSLNNYSINSTVYRLTDDAVLLSGKLRPTWWPQNSDVDAGSDNLQFLPDGTVISLQAIALGKYDYAGWHISGSTINFGQKNISCAKNSVSFLEKKIELGKLVYSTDGFLLKSETKNDALSLDIFGDDGLQVMESGFNDYGLYIKAYINLPSVLGGSALYFDRISLKEDGSFSVETSVPYFSFSFGTFSFACEDLRLGEEGLRLGSATISFTLPEETESTQIQINSLVITPDGKFQLGSSRIDPFKLWGMWIGLNNLSVVGDVVSFEGYVGLPDDEKLGALAGRKVAIQKFEITTAGVVENFRLNISGDFTFNIMDSWSLRVSTIGAKYEDNALWLTMASGTLIFPSEYPIQGARITNVAYNINTNDFYFNDMSVDLDCTLHKWGMDFSLKKIIVTTNPDTTPQKIKTIGFEGSITLPNDEDKVPEFLCGRTIEIETFSFDVIEKGMPKILVSLEGLAGELGPGLEAVRLTEGNFKIDTTGGSFIASIGGQLTFTDTAPDGLSGTSLDISSCVYDFSALKLVALEASLENFYPVILDVQCEIDEAKIVWKGALDTSYIKLTGDIILPNSLPEGIKGKAVTLAPLEFGLDGSNFIFKGSLDLTATESNPENPKIGDIVLENTIITVEKGDVFMQFMVGTKFVFPKDVFPEGLGGSSGEVKVIYNTNEGFKTISGDVIIADCDLLGFIPFKDGKISFDKINGSNVFSITVSGSMAMPDSFPEGLAGLPITGSVTFDTDGNIPDWEIALSGIDTTLFDDVCQIEDGALAVLPGPAKNELIFSVSGGISIISSQVPEKLRNVSLVIHTLEVSSLSGVGNFNVGIVADQPVELPLISGLVVTLNSLTLSNVGFSISGGVAFGPEMPSGLAGTAVSITELGMNWQGELIALAGGYSTNKPINILGFDFQLGAINIDLDKGVSIASCMVKMPENFGDMGGKSFGVVDAGFDKVSGQFYGRFAIDELLTDIAGFKLLLHDPDFDYQNAIIKFSLVELILPEFMLSAKIEIQGVSLSKDGIKVAGGGFSLPDFELAGGLGFSNVGVAMVFYDTPNADGELYSILGGGQITIPGTGTFGAELSFTNKCETYPIGLKRAFFEFYCATPQIMLGPTGLALTGIRGGIAFGKPQAGEMPANMMPYFDKGMRIQLGVRIVDAPTMGYTLQADGDMWIDVYNWTFGMNTDITILKGVLNIKSRVSAVIGKFGFYAGMYVELVFVRGQLEVWIFSPDGKQVKFAGAGNVQLGLPEGSVYDKYGIVIPPNQIWFGGINVEFGDFQDKRQGFKAWVDIPLWKSVGVFVDRSGISFDMTGLVLLKPTPTATMATVSPRQKYLNSGFDADIVVNEARTVSTALDSSYAFIVPAQQSLTAPAANGARTPNSLKSANSATIQVRDNLTLAETVPLPSSEPAYERVIFVVAYDNGDPDIRVQSPSGKIYRPGDADVETMFVEHGVAFAIASMEVGSWSISVSGIPEDAYHIDGFIKEQKPTIVLDPLAQSNVIENDALKLSGNCNRATGMISVYTVESGRDAPLQIGGLVVDANGRFDGTVSTSQLEDGDYSVFISYAETVDSVSYRVEMEESITIDRSKRSLVAPGPLQAYETTAGTLYMLWEDENGILSSGYYLTIENKTKKTSNRMYLGNIKTMEIAGYSPGEELELSLTAIDAFNRESAAAPKVSVRMAAPKPLVNIPVVNQTLIQVQAIIGEAMDGALVIAIDQLNLMDEATKNLRAQSNLFFVHTDDLDGSDVVLDPLEYISLIFPDDLKVRTDTQTLPWHLVLNDKLVEGSYSVPCTIYNLANADMAAEFTLVIEASYPEVVINTLMPETWHNSTEQLLDILGSGFLPGTRVFLGDQELTLSPQGLTSKAVQALVPAGMAAGTYDVIVQGPNGNQAKKTVDITGPEWQAHLYGEYIEAQAGTRADFHIQISGSDDFDSTVSFQAQEIPTAWLVQTPVLAAGQTGIISVFVPASAETGNYTVVMEASGGKRFPLQIRVVDTPVGPTISALDKSTAFSGEIITVYGYGFSEEGSVTLNAENCAIQAWSNTAISIVLADAASTGPLVVQADNLNSNAVTLTIRQRGFSIRLNQAEILVQGGDQLELPFMINGFADEIDLTTNVDSASGIALALSKDKVTPNGGAVLLVNLPENLAAGTHLITISGTSRNFVSSATMSLILQDAFAFDSQYLPNGMQDASYRYTMQTSNGIAPLTYRVIDGALPVGLQLAQAGILSGRPLENGTFIVDIEVVDAKGRAIVNSFNLKIENSAWNLVDRDGGNSRYIATPAPAEGRIAWSTSVNSAVQSILQSNNRVWVHLAGERTSVSALSLQGKIEYSIDSNVSWMAYAGGNLFTLEADSGLVAHAPESGLVRWNRSDVLSVTTDGSVLLAQTTEGGILLSAQDGSLLASGLSVPQALSTSVWLDGSCYYWNNTNLKLIYSEHAVSGQTVFSSQAEIATVAVDANGFVILSTNGTIYLLDTEAIELRRFDFPGFVNNSTTQLSISDNAVLVSNNEYVLEFDRLNIQERWRSDLSGSIATALDKTFIASKTELRAINRFDGQTIWQQNGSYDVLALGKNYLYAATHDGLIQCFNGADNYYAPSTTISPEPTAPDGLNGWYKSIPECTIQSADRDGYVSRLIYQLNLNEWQDYTGAIRINDGLHSIRANGTDNKGWRGPTVEVDLKIDTAAPTSQVIVEGVLSDTAWYVGPVRISFSGEDLTSGLARIELDNGVIYSSPLYFDKGEHTIHYRAIDQAGNAEAWQEVSFRIDSTPPLVSHNVRQDRGITVISLSAKDVDGNLDYIEYRINGQETRRYEGSFALTESRLYQLQYRAVDEAGNISDWNFFQTWVQSWRPSAGYAAFAELLGNEAGIYRPATPNMMLYRNIRPGRFNWVRNLPRQLYLGDAIRSRSDDRGISGEMYASFWTKRDSIVYVLGAEGLHVSGWEQLEDDIMISHEYFPEGAALYAKRYSAASYVCIPGDFALQVAPLIVISPQAQVEVRISDPPTRKELVPGEELRLYGRFESNWFDRPSDYREEWSVRISSDYASSQGNGHHGSNNSDDNAAEDEGAWEILPTDRWIVPWVDEKAYYELRLRLYAFDDALVAETSQVYTIRNQDGFLMYSPQENRALRAGSTVNFHYRASNAAGRSVQVSQWLISRDGEVWEEIVLQYNSRYRLPSSRGDFYLKAIYEVAPGLLRETTCYWQLR